MMGNMTKEELFKAMMKKKHRPIDRLSFPRQSATLAHVFKKHFTDGSESEATLPYKTVARLYLEVEEYGLPRNFTLKKHPSIGFGVFTSDKSIKPNTVIGIYTGKLMFHRVGKSVNKISLYVYGIHESLTLERKQYTKLLKEKFIASPTKKFDPEQEYEIMLDAEKEGNWTRFINHSDKSNCYVELRKIQVSESEYIVLPVIITKRKLLPNTQVTTDYGKDYWKNCNIVKQHVKVSEFKDL
jgi:hypothetical protein